MPRPDTTPTADRIRANLKRSRSALQREHDALEDAGRQHREEIAKLEANIASDVAALHALGASEIEEASDGA